MRLYDQAPSDHVEETLSFMLSSLDHANVTSAALTLFALIVLAMMVLVVQELKEIDSD